VCGLGKEWWAASDPGGSATVTPACGPPCTERPPQFQWWPKVFDGMPLRATAACHDLAGGEVPLRLGNRPSHDSLTGLPLGCWLEGTRTKGRRPSRRGRRRRGRGDGGMAAVLVTPPSAGTSERVRNGVLEAARMRMVNTTARLGAVLDRASRRRTRRSPA
jgi:hypothetical protein